MNIIGGLGTGKILILYDRDAMLYYKSHGKLMALLKER